MTAKNGGGEIRVLVAATSAVRRGGLEQIVRSSPSLKLVGSLPSLAALNSHVRDLQPDVVVVDLQSLGTQWLSPTAALPETPVVALIDDPNAQWASQVLRIGVRAILPRDSGEEEILAAIQMAHRGMVLLDPAVTADLASHVRARNSDIPLEALDELTPREIEVLRMLAEGLGNKEIATRLGISDHTVKFHISSILDKLSASSRTEAVTIGIRMGLILL